MLQEIETYLEKQWFLLPLKEQSKEPSNRVRHGFKDASNDPFQIAKWFNSETKYNLGIACEMSGLIVLDFDYRNMDQEAEKYLVNFDLLYYDQTMTVSTGDGIHYYFKTEKGKKYPGKIMQGIDIKYNGYVVGAPSIHPNGNQYRWNRNQPIELPKGIITERGLNEN